MPYEYKSLAEKFFIFTFMTMMGIIVLQLSIGGIKSLIKKIRAKKRHKGRVNKIGVSLQG
jgi:hypothetical protein